MTDNIYSKLVPNFQILWIVSFTNTTVRSRHLKCDEASPSCLRCLKDRFTCGGYGHRGLHLTYDTGSEFVFYTPWNQNATASSPPSLRSALIDGIRLGAIDNALYYHAREWVIPDLEMVGGTREVWHDIILPLSHTSKPLKYALCALGASHQRFLASYPGQLHNTAHSTDYETQASQKYSQAISVIHPIMAENKSLNIKITLLCCTIFICIENLQRRYADSVRHLKAGYPLLNHLSALVDLSKKTTGCGDYHIDRKLVTALSKMFLSLSKNIAAFTGDESFPQAELAEMSLDVGRPDVPFTNLDDAEDCLSAINSLSDNLLLGASTNPDFADPLEALSTLRPCFSAWNSRLQLLNSSKQFQSPSTNDARRMALLSLFQITWSAFLQPRREDEGFQKQEYNMILDKIQEIVLIENVQSRPSFTFDGHLVCELSTICASCRDVEIRTKALGILRSIRRREGIWDSWEVANVYENVFTALESDRLTWNDLPWGFAQLCKKLNFGPITTIHCS